MFLFLKKIVKFGVSVIVMIIAMASFDYFIIGRQYNDNYDVALIDKVERLKGITEAKIILVGDSNVAFGINSEKIEEELGMPVVNLGLHGALGNAFHEQIAKLNIGGGVY